MQRNSTGAAPTRLMQLAALLLAVALGAAAGAQDEGQTLEELVGVLQNVANTPRGANTPEEDARNFEMLRTGVPQLQSYLQRNDFVNARRIVRSWARETDSETLKTLCQTVIAHLEKKLDETETPLLDRADDLFDRAAKVCREASSASDLDEIGDALFEFRNFEMGNHQASRVFLRTRGRIDNAVRFVETYQQFLDAQSSGDRGEALQVLSQLSHSNYGNTRLLSSSEISQRRRDLEKALYEEASAALDAISASFSAQAGLDDLQKLQMQVDDLYNQINFGSGAAALRTRLDRTRSSLQSWTAVMLAEANDDGRGALEQLRQMQENSYLDRRTITAQAIAAKYQSLVSRLDKEQPEHAVQIASLLQGIKTAADLAAARLELDSIRLSQVTTQACREIDALSRELDQIAALYGALDQGRYEVLWINAAAPDTPASQHRWNEQTTQLRHAAVRQAIVKSVGLEAFEPAGADESPAIGLLRLADQAAAAGDWLRTYQLLDVYAMAFARQIKPAWLTAELAGCQAYLAGVQLEAFGQREQAADSYLTVLHQLGTRIPRQEAATRLEAIRGGEE